MKADTILRYNADEVSVKELSQLIDEGKELNVVKLHATIKSQQEIIERMKLEMEDMDAEIQEYKSRR